MEGRKGMLRRKRPERFLGEKMKRIDNILEKETNMMANLLRLNRLATS